MEEKVIEGERKRLAGKIHRRLKKRKKTRAYGAMG